MVVVHWEWGLPRVGGSEMDGRTDWIFVVTKISLTSDVWTQDTVSRAVGARDRCDDLTDDETRLACALVAAHANSHSGHVWERES